MSRSATSPRDALCALVVIFCLGVVVLWVVLDVAFVPGAAERVAAAAQAQGLPGAAPARETAGAVGDGCGAPPGAPGAEPAAGGPGAHPEGCGTAPGACEAVHGAPGAVAASRR